MSDDELEDDKKMSKFKAYMALCKGYCAINILVLPKQFDNGGWLVGVLSIMIAAGFVTMCALKLLQCGEKIGVYTYPGIAERALGRGGKIIVDIFLSFCQFSFTVAQISFTLKTL